MGAEAGDAADAGAPPTAARARWHAGDTRAAFSFRHASAASPPVGTPAQFAWKSDRHAERIAAPCSDVGCCA
jgi:hypothetical protein